MRPIQATRPLVVALLICLGAVPAVAQDVRLAYLFSDGNLPGMLAAYTALLEERPDLRERVVVEFLTESLFEDVDPGALLETDVLVFDVMNQQMLERFNTTHDVDLIERISGQGLVLGVGEGLLPREQYVEQGVVWDDRARAFWANWGLANQLGLMKQALSAAGIADLTVPDPQPSLDGGYYYPDGGTGRVFATWEAFDDWRRGAGKRRPGATRVAVGFYKSNFYAGDTALLDAVIAEIERQGAEAIPVFGYPAGLAFEALLLDAAGDARADVALAFVFRFAGPDAAASLQQVNIPVISLVSLYGRSEAEWRDSPEGLSMFEGTFQVAVPELSGLVAPTVVGSQERLEDPATGLTIVVRQPIASRVTMAVRRALRYAALRATPNIDKRVAVLFYNYPPGKAGIGASYLNVAESLANILERLEREGYDLGGGTPDLSADAVLREITTKARNVGGYAPGELDDMLLAHESAVRISLADYRRWLDEYAPELRAKVLADWGEPEATTLMASDGSLIIPAVRYGNVVLLPQPARGWGEDAEKLYHADDLAPHHQYVATYAWLRADAEGGGFGADAVIHLGTHGTLEWLDGKAIGLSAADAPDALMADLPDLYVYNVDVVGEGLVARRRGMATLVDHMVPPFAKSALLPELAALSESINDYLNNLSKNAQLAAAYADQIREQVTDLGMAKDLGVELNTDGELDHDVLHAIEEYMVELRGQHVPYGLHAFGRTPDATMRESTVEAIVSVDRSLLPEDAAVMAADMERRIVESGPREVDSLVRALDGGYVPVGGGGEPIRNPDAYPTGKNFYGIDPAKVPKPAAWELGCRPGRPDAGGTRGRAWPLSREGVVRDLGRRDDAARGDPRVADLSSPRDAPRVGRARQRRRRRRHSREPARPAAGRHRHRLGRRGHVQQRHPADGRGGAAREGPRRGPELCPPPLSGDASGAHRPRLLRGRRRPPGRGAHLRRAARHLQPEHLGDRRGERHLGQRPGDGRRVSLEDGARLRERLLGRADGGCVPAGALRHRQGWCTVARRCSTVPWTMTTSTCTWAASRPRSGASTARAPSWW